MKIGEKVKDFCLHGIDENGEEKDFSLYQFKGKNVVAYFYPKDETPGCTQEACDFRDNINKLSSSCDTVVLGISADDIESHKKFQEKHNLNFILLSDPKHEVLDQFEAWGPQNLYGKMVDGTIRSTFLIDKNDYLKKEWKKVKVEGHVDEVLAELNAMCAEKHNTPNEGEDRSPHRDKHSH